MNKKEALLVLEDGTIFKGIGRGYSGTVMGEICFNTGMTGYQEVFTDPSYYGQLVVCTNVHIGNYGVNSLETESGNVKINGMICKSFSETHSRQRESGTLQTYFEEEKIVAISEIDTRKLVKHIRTNGAMNAIICTEEKLISELQELLSDQPSMKGQELASKVSTKEAYTVGDASASYKVALVDLGVKANIINSLTQRDCFVKVFPYNSKPEEILAWEPDGILMSNGPGDPAPLNETIDNVKVLIDFEVPMLGICLGHQLIALSQGLKTFKMHNGHRGINHPVKNLITGKSEITSQNHGFAVEKESADGKNVEITHIHLNDETIAGIRLKDKPVFSVQYHPEASPGPTDAAYLFDDFIKLMQQKKVTALV